MDAIKLENVSKDFAGLSVLKNLTFEINAGEFIGFLGPSGCGKSTLLSLISGLTTPTQGKIINTFSKKNTSFVFQEASLMPWQTVEKNIALPLSLGLFDKNKISTDIINIEVRNMLKMFNLEDYAHYYPRQLSGGMKMRTSLARALISNPKLLLLDEPFSSLDELLREKCADEVLEITKKQNLTSILVTHSISEAVYLCDKVYILSHKPCKIIEAIEIKKTSSPDLTRGSSNLDWRGTEKFHTVCQYIKNILLAPQAL